MSDKEEHSSSSEEEYDGSSEEEIHEAESEDEEKIETKVYLPQNEEPLEKGERLVCDKSVYKVYHHFGTASPCLSFDIIQNSNNTSDDYPATVYAVGGTQSDNTGKTHIVTMKLSNLNERDAKDRDSDSSEDESSDEEDEDKMPVFQTAKREHKGGINRIRYTKCKGKQLVATWSENFCVNIFDMKNQTNALRHTSAIKSYNKDKKMKTAPPLFRFDGYMTEGFAMDWSPNGTGSLLTGDFKNNIFLLEPRESTWVVDQTPFKGHKASVEEVLWHPEDQKSFASCSVDKSIRFWSKRVRRSEQIKIKDAHSSDVNVMSWHKTKQYYLLSGGDDGVVKVWDLRNIKKSPEAIASFKYHTKAITSIEWSPHDDGVFAASGEDDQITIWDLGVERDESGEKEEGGVDVPPQLLFVHQGQEQIKEIHWHNQYKGMIMSTAGDGFNVFRTISV